MGLPWVRGRIKGSMKDGSIIAHVTERQTIYSDRPVNLEASGADLEVYHKLQSRKGTFEFETYGFLGGAIAWVLPTSRLELLPVDLMPRLQAFNRVPLSENMYAALIRNAGAPTIQFCAEPAGGMPEDAEIDWLFDLLDEGTEIGVYNDNGWLGFLLPINLRRYQTELDKKQAEWWQIVRPDLKCQGYALVTFLSRGRDALDGETGIICPCLTAGEFSFLKVATLELPGSGWKLCDLECRKAGNDWQPLNRTIIGIFPRTNMSPMAYRFSPNGGIDHCGPHFPLSGEVVEYVLSHLSIPLLGPRGFGWL